MSLVLLNNRYYNQLQKKYSNFFSKMNPKQQNIARDAMQLAMRAGYEQARIDRMKELERMRIPKYQWDEEEDDYVENDDDDDD